MQQQQLLKHNKSVFTFSDFLIHRYLKLRFVTNTFWTKVPKRRHWIIESLYMTTCKGHDTVVSLSAGDDTRPAEA